MQVGPYLFILGYHKVNSNNFRLEPSHIGTKLIHVHVIHHSLDKAIA